MADGDRHSRADEPVILTDPVEQAKREVENGFRQYDAVREQIQHWIETGRQFRLRPSHISSLQRIALEGLSGLAGVYRPSTIAISGSKHTPPPAHLVAERVEELCDYVNAEWEKRSALHLAAYVLWRLNWIHPFTDGNGRTSRVVSFLVMCVKLGIVLPGTKAVPEFIAEDKTPYYRALEVADEGFARTGEPDLTAMESLLEALLARQLAEVHKRARSI